MIRLGLITFLFGFIYFIYGCSPAGVVASSAGGVMVVAEGDKSLGTVVDDATIKLNVTAQVFRI